MDMLGRIKHTAQVKTTITQSDVVNMSLQQIDVPRTICQYYNNVELSFNVMFVNNVIFLTSISEYIHHGKVNTVDNLKYHAWKIK